MPGGLAAHVAAWWGREGGAEGELVDAGPSGPGLPLVELQLGGSWINITGYVRYEFGISITRGRTDEGRQVDRGTCRLTLDNTDGRFSPRNPVGAYYGLIGRNTPLRVSVDYQGGRTYRITGEVSTWPVGWDTKGVDVYVTVEASGILRRLSQGATPLKSAPRRWIPGQGPIAYWPCEDEGPRTRLSLPAVGAHPLKVFSSGSGTRKFATEPMADWLGSGIITDNDASPLQGQVDFGTSTAVPWDVHVMFRIRDVVDTQAGLEVWGANQVWFVFLAMVDSKILVQHAVDGVIVEDVLSSVIDPLNDTQVHHLILRVSQPDWFVILDGTSVHSGTFAGSQATISHIRLDGLDGEVEWSHLAVFNTDTLPDKDEAAHVAFGHTPVGDFPAETAGRRIERLCAEEGIEFTPVGDLDDTHALGPQYRDTLLTILREAADTDLGILFEPRNALGLGYRTRVSMYNQSPRLALGYSASGFLAELQPVDDDQATRNDVTVQRRSGSTSARAVLESGALSVQAPPDGVGIYDEDVTANPVGDGFLPELASWRLHLGTVDEARYPVLRGWLNDDEITEGLRLNVLDTDIGDRITVEDPPAWLPPDTISVLVQGSTETVDDVLHEITFNTSPESPYRVGEYEAAEGQTYKYDTAGSSLAAAFVAGTDTSMSVSVDILPLWTTDADEFPFDIECAGARLTVTAIAGGSSPQTFTIVQAPVNGVTKTIPAGTAVSLWTKATYGL